MKNAHETASEARGNGAVQIGEAVAVGANRSEPE
jgi:hypothetical protein